MKLSPIFDRRAFTLVEIMIVVGILALLAALALPAFARAKQRAQATVFAAEVKTTVEALEMYQGEHGTLPPPRLEYFAAPEDFAPYLPKTSTWASYSSMGGRWVWFGDILPLMPGRDAVLGIYLPTVSDEQLRMADQALDDGSLATGNYQKNGGWYFAGLDD